MDHSRQSAGVREPRRIHCSWSTPTDVELERSNEKLSVSCNLKFLVSLVCRQGSSWGEEHGAQTFKMHRKQLRKAGAAIIATARALTTGTPVLATDRLFTSPTGKPMLDHTM
ncbi:MAG: hypothetical protein HC767_04565 [Akkermansiaceae bacterium]|nr:hypothetical protein [Akkermansiaceae bacterium]